MKKDKEHHGAGCSRRVFVKKSVMAAGAMSVVTTLSRRRAGGAFLGANNSVGIGYIGVGIRGEILMRRTQSIDGTHILEVADLYDGHLERSKEVVGASLRAGKDYRRLLDNKEINAVVVAVPDHWHKQIALDAMLAGKDVYLEKPMTHRWEDGASIIAEAKKRNRILQVGSQYQSMPANERAVEIIKSGKLGKITLISGQINRNTSTGAWYYPIPPDASPQTVDWQQFIGPARKHEFDAKRFFRWRLYWDYSGGLPTDLFVHLITATHTLMGAKMTSRVAAMGGIYNWREREVPDQMSAIVEYPEGFQLMLTSTASNNHNYPLLTIMGTEGTLEYHGTKLVYYAEPVLEDFAYSTNSWPVATKKKYAEINDLDPESMRPRATANVKRPMPVEIETSGTEATQAHLAKFFESVRTRIEPVENAEMGHYCATVGHMVNLSYKSRKEVRWDPAKQKVVI
ncbi:MAG: Gfo/Idh/MocA family oxidoreductase [Acidobacteriota bacterium]|nr:Gfo/Idh/MocA family oxidoreductase [Acidobacteriota bacterium]